MNTESYLQYLPELPLQPDKKQNMVMKTYKEIFGTCIKSNKAYINAICTKSASKDSPNCFAIFGSSAQGQHVFSMFFPDMYSSSILQHKCPRTNLNLIDI